MPALYPTQSCIPQQAGHGGATRGLDDAQRSARPARMKLRVNGEERSLGGPTLTVVELLAELGLGGRRVAVEVNRRIVPRTRHAEASLSEGDQVEIVEFVGGG